MGEILGLDPDAVTGKLLRVWAWFDDHTEEGNAPSVTTALLNRISGVSGFMEAMHAVGWAVIDRDAVQLINFDRHNGKTAKTRALTARRVANHKFKADANAKGNAASVSSALPRIEENRKEESIKKEKERAIIPQVLDTEVFRQAWGNWKLHRIEKNKPLGEIESEPQLAELMRFGPDEAADVVLYSIRVGAVNLILNGDHRQRCSPGAARSSGGETGKDKYERMRL